MLNVLETEVSHTILGNPLVAPWQLTIETVDNQIDSALCFNTFASCHLVSTFGHNEDIHTNRSSDKSSSWLASHSEDGSKLASSNDKDKDQIEGWESTNQQKSSHLGKSVQIFRFLLISLQILFINSYSTVQFGMFHLLQSSSLTSHMTKKMLWPYKLFR